MSLLVSPEVAVFLFLVGGVLMVVSAVQALRADTNPSLALWLSGPALLTSQRLLLHAIKPDLASDRAGESLRAMLAGAAILCWASLIVIMLLSARRGARARIASLSTWLGLAGAAGISVLVASGAATPLLLVAAACGVGALALTSDEAAHELSPTAGVLWALLLAALAMLAPESVSHDLDTMLARASSWSALATSLRDGDVLYGRVTAASALAALSGLLVMAVNLRRWPAPARRDPAGLAVLLASLLIGLFGVSRLMPSSAALPGASDMPAVRALIEEVGPLPVAPAGLRISDGLAPYKSRRDALRCVMVLDGGGWRLRPLLGGALGCARGSALFPYYTDGHPLVVPAGRLAREVAREVTRGLQDNRVEIHSTALAPIAAPTRSLAHLESQAWPFIKLRWDGSDAFRQEADAWRLVVMRGERAYLFCRREVLMNEPRAGGPFELRRYELGAARSGWSAAAAKCGDVWGEVTIALDERQTVQDVVDACAAIQRSDNGCALFDGLPEEVARQLAELEGTR